MSKTFKQYKDDQTEHEAWLKSYEKVIAKRRVTDMVTFANGLLQNFADGQLLTSKLFNETTN